MAGSFELKPAKTGFLFNLKADNSQVILTSEIYTTKPNALNGIESVRKNSKDDGRFERKTAKDGSPYFVLTATNGQVIGSSQMYSSTAAMEKGIASVKTNGPDAELKDLTV